MLHTGATGLTATLSLFALFTPNLSKQLSVLCRLVLLEVSSLPLWWDLFRFCTLILGREKKKKLFENAGGCGLAHCK